MKLFLGHKFNNIIYIANFVGINSNKCQLYRLNSNRESGWVDVKIGNSAWERVLMVLENGIIKYSNTTPTVYYYTVPIDRVISLRADVSSTVCIS